MTKKSQTRGSDATPLGVAAVVMMLVCCAGPAVLAGGGLAALGGGLAAVGGFLSNPRTILSGLVVAGTGLLALLLRRRNTRHGTPGEDSCDLSGTAQVTAARPRGDSRPDERHLLGRSDDEP